MKAARILGICVGVVILLALIGFGIAMSSPFQTWAARKVIAGQPGVHATLGSVSVGFKRVEVRDLKAEKDGAVLTLPSLDAELPVLDAALSKRVNVTKLVAHGWTLDLTKVDTPALPAAAASTPGKVAANPREFSLIPSAQAATAPTPAAAPSSKAVATAFRGVLVDLKLPVDLSLDGVDTSGEVIVPDPANKNPARFRVTLKGGGLASGKEGSFAIDAAGAKSDQESLDVKGILLVAMDTPRTFTSVGLKADASAKGGAFPNGVSLKISTRAARTPGGEAYDLSLASEQKSLADIRAALAVAASKISGEWKLDLHDTDVAPFALGHQIPVFEAIGDGSFETGTRLDEVRARGQLKAAVSRLEVLRPELSAVGSVRLATEFDVLQHHKSLRVERLDASLTGEKPVASVHALQAFEFNLDAEDLQLNVADPAKELVAVKLNGLPLAWLKPFTGDVEFSGGDVQGEFNVGARDGGLALRAQTPLTILKSNVAQAGNPILRDVDVSIDASADYFATRAWQAQIAQLSLKEGGHVLLGLTAKAGQQAGENSAIKATGTWQTDLTAWSTQPVAAGKLQIASGKAEGDFSASIDGTKAVEMKFVLSNVVAATKETLPTVTAEIRAEIAGDGKVTFQAPVLFDQSGRKSDLLFAGTLTPGTPSPTLEGRLSSEKVVVEDVQLLALLSPSGAPKPESPNEPDTAPFWGSIRGQLTLALKKVIYANSFEASDVSGVLRLEATEMKLDQIHASVGGEGNFQLNGGVTFDPKAKEAYRLASTVALTNFDTGPAFRALYPEKLPTLDARLNINGQIAGEGANIAALSERARGRFDVVSKGGVLRALSTVLPSEKSEGWLQAGLSMVGSLGGSTGKYFAAASEAVKMLAEIPFDQMSFVTERDANLNLLLKDFSLISPDVRLGGMGQVTYAPGKRLIDQALDLQLSLRARGKLGDLLSQAKMLNTEKDNLGYVALNAPIKIGGTLGKTKNDLGAKILAAVTEKSGLGEALDNILGRGKERTEN